jgi:hypothetical protein
LQEGGVVVAVLLEILGGAEDDGFHLFHGHAVGQVGDEAGFAAWIGGAAEERLRDLPGRPAVPVAP